MAELQQLSAATSDQPQPQTPEQASSGDQTGQKRKGDASTPGQPRAKRNRYISIACNECKRRKIKCNGQTPCVRCGNLNLDCLYAPNCCTNNFRDSNEFKQMNANILSLQDQVDSLWQNLTALRGALGQDLPPQDSYAYTNDTARAVAAPQASMIDPALSRGKLISPGQQRSQAPPNSSYSFDIARSSLQSMGITSEDGMDASAIQQEHGVGSNNFAADQNTYQLHHTSQPIASISREEGLRLINVYESDMGVMFPIIDIVRIVQYATLFMGIGDHLRKSGDSVKSSQGIDFSADDEDLNVLKIVLAIGLVIDAGGYSDLAKRLFDTTAKHKGNSFESEATMGSITIMTLSAQYLFLLDEGSLSWRMLGVAARLSQELGLNRSETYVQFKSEEDRNRAIRLFWTVYVLDRRSGFETGMSFAMQDSQIDTSVPQPNESAPYLVAMITYAHLEYRAWSLAHSQDPLNAFHNGECGQVDQEIIEWYRSLPDNLQYLHPAAGESLDNIADIINTKDGRALHRMRVILYLYQNHARILAYRPALQSATVSRSDAAQLAVDIAKDTIRLLYHVANTSEVYHTQNMFFEHFIASTLAILFLAVSHAPARYSSSCRDEFLMTLGIVRTLSMSSHVNKRLSLTVRGLKEIGPRMGLYARKDSREAQVSAYQPGGQRSSESRQHDAHSSAAMAMADLAGRPIDELAFFAGHKAGAQVGSGGSATGREESLNDPDRMANDLTTLFEAAVKYGSAETEQDGRPARQKSSSKNVGDTVGMAHGSEEELAKIMQELF